MWQKWFAQIWFPFFLSNKLWFLGAITNGLRPPGGKAVFPSLPCFVAEQWGSGQWQGCITVTFRNCFWREETGNLSFALVRNSFYLLVTRSHWTEPHDLGKQGRLKNPPPLLCTAKNQIQALKMPIHCLIKDQVNYLPPLLHLSKTQTKCKFPSFPQVAKLWPPLTWLADNSSWEESGHRVKHSLTYCPIKVPSHPTFSHRVLCSLLYPAV